MQGQSGFRASHGFAIAWVLLAAGCASTGGWFSNQQEQVAEAYAKFYQARTDQDWETLSRSLAKEFVYHIPTGGIADKKTYLAAQQADGAIEILSNTLEQEAIRVYEGTAVNRGVARVEAVVDGQNQTVSLRYLNLWIWRDQRWQLAARQSNFVQPPPVAGD